MNKISIKSDKAPQPIGPYTHAVLECYKYRMETSGQSGRDPLTGKLLEGIEAQTEQALNNIEAILSEVGLGFDNIIKMRVYLLDMKNYPKVNNIYEKRFKNNFPARTLVSVHELPDNAQIEIECIAGGNELQKK